MPRRQFEYSKHVPADHAGGDHQGLADVLRCMVVAFDPDWGTATLDRQAEAFPPEDRDAFAGWISFFSARRGQLPPLDPQVRVEPIGDKGMLVILTPERFSTENPAHMDLSTRINDLLVEAGIVHRLR